MRSLFNKKLSKPTRKMLVVCPYPHDVAPSQRLKFEQYYDCFRGQGWGIEVRSFISPDFWKILYKPGCLFQKVVFTLKGYLRRFLLLFEISKFDLVYIHLWVTPFGPPIFEWLVRKRARRIIYDIDDLVFLPNLKSSAHAFLSGLKGRRKPIFLMQVADHVITCTPYLDKFAQRYNRHTTDISSTVKMSRYFGHCERNHIPPLTIGWSGSHSTVKYFHLLAPVLLELKRKHSFRIIVMGVDAISIDGLDIEAVAWDGDIEIETLKRFDIGVYPLPDEEWVYGKSGLKAIQYMALGIPVIASAIGANFRVIEDKESGFLVNSEEEWLSAFETLLNDYELRCRMGEAGKARVERLFSVESNERTYLKILEAVNGG